MTPDSHAIDVDERMALRQLLDCRFLIGQTVVAQIAVAEGVIPLRAMRISPAIPNFDHDETELRQHDVGALRREGFVNALSLWAGINERDDGVFLVRVEVEGLVHYPVQIRYAVVRFHLEGLWKFVPGLHERSKIRNLERHHCSPLPIE